MKRFMLGLTTIVALVAMTLLGLTAPAAHADDSVPYGTPNPAVVLNPDVVSGYPSDAVTVQPFLNDSGPNLELVGYTNLQGPAYFMQGGNFGSGKYVMLNYPASNELTVWPSAPGTITLNYQASSNWDGVTYTGSITIVVKQYQPAKVKRVKGKKGVFDVYDPNPPCQPIMSCDTEGNGDYITFGKSSAYASHAQRHSRVKVGKQYYKYLTSHKKITWRLMILRPGGGVHNLYGKLKYPMGKKAYKQYKKAHKKHHHHTSSLS